MVSKGLSASSAMSGHNRNFKNRCDRSALEEAFGFPRFAIPSGDQATEVLSESESLCKPFLARRLSFLLRIYQMGHLGWKPIAAAFRDLHELLEEYLMT